MNKLEVYNRLYEILKRDTKSFKFVLKKLNNQNVNSYPILHLAVVSSNFITLDSSVQVEQVEFDAYIIASVPPNNSIISESELLMKLTQEVEEALAKPSNWYTNHLGFKGFVHDVQVVQIQYYDDSTAGEGTISASVTFVVVESATGFEKDYIPESQF